MLVLVQTVKGRGGSGPLLGHFVNLASFGPCPPCTCMQTYHKYTVTVTTSDLREADFDGEAYITFHGNGDTHEVPLVKPGRIKALFKGGTTEEFVLWAEAVEYIERVTLRMVPTAADPAWHVDKVEVSGVLQCALSS